METEMSLWEAQKRIGGGGGGGLTKNRECNRKVGGLSVG